MSVYDGASKESEVGWRNFIPVVLAAAEAMPRRAGLAQHLDDVGAANARGYFLPDEDERLREMYARYLSVRSGLLEAVEAISAKRYRPGAVASPEAFAVAFAAAAILVRAASFLVQLAEQSPLVKERLDEGEPRYDLKVKSFTSVYRSLTAPRRYWGFYEAVRYFQRNRESIINLKAEAEMRAVIELIELEAPYFEEGRRNFLKQRLRYRIHSYLRRRQSGYRKVMFQLFRVSGSTIAELKQPFIKPRGSGKRVTPEIRRRLECFLQPGDVLVTRHDDALSNLFLPGFWPHAALYVGTAKERAEMGVKSAVTVGLEHRFLEAKKDGVRLRSPEDTLRVDALTVLRPSLGTPSVARALERALTHAGKLYDFIFDFGSPERLACTELIYRSYHGTDAIAFQLAHRAGRYCLSAEDLINQAIGGGWFEPVLVYGLDGEDWREGPDARARLAASYEATWWDASDALVG